MKVGTVENGSRTCALVADDNNGNQCDAKVPYLNQESMQRGLISNRAGDACRPIRAGRHCEAFKPRRPTFVESCTDFDLVHGAEARPVHTGHQDHQFQGSGPWRVQQAGHSTK